MNKKLLFILLNLSFTSFGQNLDQIGKVPLIRYNGGISANGVFYEGAANRAPFTYFVNGNINFNISGIYNIPLSFSYTNQDLAFSTPFKINRLSIHPSYKWVTTHIGDVSMSFSPYTLSGHQFTGGGVELTPQGPFKISALYGRFLKASEFNEEVPQAIPAYERFGFGLKTSYDFRKISLGLIFFSAKDNENSLDNPIPATLELTPQENTVVSAEASFSIFEKTKINIEYALSGVTENTRITAPRTSNGVLSFLLNENLSTNYFNAFNVQLDYPAGNGSLGVGYERIDPNYRTFGAYYFNNDLENITVNASQNIFNNKVSISFNGGLQKDNLDDTKSSELQRIVSAFNVTYTASDKLSVNAGYSNFQSFTNIQNQFDFINEVNQFDNIDTLNYRQISQNANLGINYTLKKTKAKQQAINLNLTYQNAKNQQNEETVENGLTQFYNASSAYTLGYPNQSLNISLAANATYSSVGETDNLTLGPTLGATKSFFDKKLRTNFSSSYNTAFANGEKQNDVFNIRFGSSYSIYESHNLNLSLLSLFRGNDNASNVDFTATLGYSYTFDTFKIKIKKRNRKILDQESIDKLGKLQFRYRSVTYSGTIAEVTQQIENVKNGSKFRNIPNQKLGTVNFLFAELKKQNKTEPYKNKAIEFLDALYGYDDFLKLYDDVLAQVIDDLKDDMENIDYNLEKSLVKTKIKLDETLKENPENKAEIDRFKENLNDREQKLIGHRWTKKKFDTYQGVAIVKKPDELMANFKKKEVNNVFKIYEGNKDLNKIKEYLEYKIIDFYYHQSLNETNPEKLELRYIDKN